MNLVFIQIYLDGIKQEVEWAQENLNKLKKNKLDESEKIHLIKNIQSIKEDCQLLDKQFKK